MTSRVFDNGSGATLLQSANRTAGTALATTTIVKTTGALTFGFSTSAKGNAVVALVNAMYTAMKAAGIMT